MADERYRFAGFELDVAAHRLTRGGVPIQLQPKPMELLVHLLRSPGRLVTRSEAEELLWPDTVVTENSLRQVVHKLRDGLGSEPVETVPRVGVRLVAEVELAPLAIPIHLPPERDAFVGRSAELARLEAGGPLVTLVGPGGVGKTRLATRSARLRAAAWSGGVWFCDLSDARTEQDVVLALARTLDVPLLVADSPARVGHALAGRGPLLVVLDNAEQVAEALAGLVQAWRAVAPQADLLVTSRVALALPEESVIEVGPLPPVDAIALYRARTASAADPQVVAEIVARLDGLPLAVELAAGRGTSMPDRHASLERTLAWSWELLSPDGQEALAQLSVFAGGFGLEAAETVLALPGSVVDAVEALCRCSLVQRVGRRFDLLQSVRLYAEARLIERGKATAARERHAAWAAGFGTEEAIAALHGQGGVERRAEWQQELDNLVLAGRRGSAGAALAVAELLRRSGPPSLTLELLDGCTGASERDRARIGVAAAVALLDLWRLDEAEARLTAVRSSACDRRDPVSEAEALQVMALLEHHRGHVDLAAARVEAGIALVAGRTGAEALRVRLEATAGAVAQYQGRLEEARTRLEGCLAAFRASGDVGNAARVCLNLAIVLGRLEEVEPAGLAYREALDGMRRIGDRFGVQTALTSLGAWCERAGRPAESRAWLETALTLARELGDRRGEAQVLTNLGLLTGVADPRGFLERALAIHRELAWDYGHAFALCGLARVERAEGRAEQALALLDEAVMRSGSYSVPQAMASVLRAAVHLDAGRVTEGRADAERARSHGPHGVEEVELAVVDARLALLDGDRVGAGVALASAASDPALVSAELAGVIERLRSEL